MRPDMVKVIVERERAGSIRNYHFARNKKKFAPKDLEEAVTHEGMTRRHRYFWGNSKSINENLSPLKGFLRSRVGKPWNKVYSELNEFVNPRNAVQKHIRQHVDSYVELHAYKDAQGNYYTNTRWAGRSFLQEGELYVNQAGILCAAKEPKQKIKLLPGQKLYTIYRQATHPDPKEPNQRFWFYNTHVCLHADFEKLPASPYIRLDMTFIACCREDIAKALKECAVGVGAVMWVSPDGARR